MAKHLFTTEELQQIEQAVRDAEAASGGEIVPVFVRQSSFYEMALWRGGFLLSAFTALALTLFYAFTDGLLFLPPYLWLLIVLTAGLWGALLVAVLPSLKRWLIGKRPMHVRALDQAKNMFYDYQVADTEQRTGILLFISFFEKQVVILGDVGISEVVPEDRWQDIVTTLIQGLKQGKTTPSICQAIQSCGQLLEQSDIQHAESDNNELSDNVRFHE